MNSFVVFDKPNMLLSKITTKQHIFYLGNNKLYDNLLYKVNRLLKTDYKYCATNMKPIFYKPSVAILLTNTTICLINSKKYTYNSGTLIHLTDKFNDKIVLNTTNNIYFYNMYDIMLESIYLNVENRYKYNKLINYIYNDINKETLNKCEVLGNGDYGYVYKTMLGNNTISMKITNVKPDKSIDSIEFEIKMLEHVLGLTSKCQNLPIMFNKMKTDKQVTLFTELANGTLKEFFESSPNVYETKSALFQILAGLHTIQMNGQIMHFDIKAQNILYYNVIPGGCWKYVINGQSFYVPNYGKLFVINDFGISRPLSPYLKITYSKHEHFKLGSRYGIIVNNKITPLQMNSDNIIYWTDNNMVSNCEQFFMFTNNDTILSHNSIKLTKEQETCLKTLNITIDSTSKTVPLSFFLHPNIIPPFEFYNDTQDCIRMFIGGKRTTQKGHHMKYKKLNTKLRTILLSYNGKGENCKAQSFSYNPCQILAGRLLVDLFSKHSDYLEVRTDVHTINIV